ncbi:hypothetical protein [Escherichia coli]|uniref:hypothetical protein n=1 Tax=Escherichia coli TaxID=562 RepID=UPI00201DB05D|nr:hypothetical protein [Escherichia coli]
MATQTEVARLISSESDEYSSEETEHRFNEGLQIYGYSPEDVSKARNKMAGFLAGGRHAEAFAAPAWNNQ